MVKIIKYLLYAVAAVAVLVIALDIFAKKSYQIERSITIDAPTSMIYDYVRHFKNFDQWSPWTALDPQQKTTLSGPDGAIGASHFWNGNDKVGEGRQTITAIGPDFIKMETEFLRPFKSTSEAQFQFAPDGEQTKVTWSFHMRAPFPLNGLMMFTDVDEGVGKDYEIGLENLKRILEEKAHRKYLGYEVKVEETYPERTFAGIRQLTDTTQVGNVYAAHIQKVSGMLAKAGIQPAGPPVALFYTWENGKTDMATAVPVSEGIPAGLGSFRTPARKAYVIDYFGPYEQSMKAHAAMDAYLAEQELVFVPPVLEEYLSGPGTEPDTAKWHTKVIYFADPKSK